MKHVSVKDINKAANLSISKQESLVVEARSRLSSRLSPNEKVQQSERIALLEVTLRNMRLDVFRVEREAIKHLQNLRGGKAKSWKKTNFALIDELVEKHSANKAA